MRLIAIFGGTFDPIHIGHLRVALDAAEALDAEVRLVPARVPPHRPPPIASAEQRVAMLQLVLAGQQRLTLDTRELRRDGPSYTVDTLRELRAELPAEQPLVLLLGADAFGGLTSWREWRGLFELAHIGVLTRPGHDAEPAADLAAELVNRKATSAAQLQLAPAGKVLDIRVTPLEISASGVRALLARGGDARWLVPDALCASPALLGIYRSVTAAGKTES